jgi:hypothetical protein
MPQADVAQLVEHLSCKEDVSGSNPLVGSTPKNPSHTACHNSNLVNPVGEAGQ